VPTTIAAVHRCGLHRAVEAALPAGAEPGAGADPEAGAGPEAGVDPEVGAGREVGGLPNARASKAHGKEAPSVSWSGASFVVEVHASRRASPHLGGTKTHPSSPAGEAGDDALATQDQDPT
jgi:hypothetical protein